MELNINYRESFVNRHIGPDEQELEEMLKLIGVDDVGQLISETIPPAIGLRHAPALPESKPESAFLEEIRSLASQNKVYKSFIGQGYYDTVTPNVILRNILENPGWYTAYTPYQAEIAQGRLEALVNFQTVIADLTGMELANASLLDEPTAAAEGMSLLYNARKGNKKKANRFFIDSNCFVQTKEVLKTRAIPVGIEIIEGHPDEIDPGDETIFGVLLQTPDANGEIYNYTELITKLHAQNTKVVVATDLMALAIMKPAGEMGADVVVGSSQRFGVPMGYGGPHAAFFATLDAYKRQVPGRIIGISVDQEGNPAYRMALQTREQHIKRDRATSNICTAQVLLAVMAGAYAVYHGPEGLRKIAERIHGLTKVLSDGLKKIGIQQNNNNFFDTLSLKLDKNTLQKVKDEAVKRRINFHYYDEENMGISLDETTLPGDIKTVFEIFDAAGAGKLSQQDFEQITQSVQSSIPEQLQRKSRYLQYDVFQKYHSEHEMLRYLKRLENRDLSMVHSMISLGSCTMKLNATAEMIPVTWPEFSKIHPYAPADQAKGYHKLFDDLNKWLCEITGFEAISFQPNSGAQGEFTGLMTIRAYHENNGEDHRRIALIPSSAHGTNPASAVMAGMKVVVVRCDDYGNVDLEDIKKRAEEHKDNLAALMVTYPSTHGVFEEQISDICKIIHTNGGLVYMDGANMNAQVGFTSPGKIGADVCHLNLHKTFCIPHGGGGPGMGPIGVNKQLAPFLPNHPRQQKQNKKGISAIAGAPFGSASILPISYGYIAMMGRDGLQKATEFAIINANYLKTRLEAHYKILYTGSKGRSGHEFILDCREFKNSAGIEVEDIAKRLIDYCFHAPTVSFPVPGTMMVEPAESETKEELDRFCEALIAIRKEIKMIEKGEMNKENNPLKNAPHTSANVINSNWDKPYSREIAAFPLSWVRDRKFWPFVSRIDSAYGDRNLVCSCAGIEAYMEQPEKTGVSHKEPVAE